MTTGPAIRCQIVIHGAVQGVGFRPFMFRLAQQLGLFGWVSNMPQGVITEVEGPRDMVDLFVKKIDPEKPALASVHACEVTELDPAGYIDFQIRESFTTGTKHAVILPDIALCPDCLRELNDPSDRRYRYPFINCTNCGPRWSIIESLPYDRANTSMKRFAMCPDCQKEYDDPSDRRFHAQPNACPVCGPKLRLVTNTGTLRAENEDAVLLAVRAMKEGKILAVKGIGGYHLMADPFHDGTVLLLRQRKHREEKPFAVMMPDLGTAGKYCVVTEKEALALKGTAAPIVLVRRRAVRAGTVPLSPFIAPNNPLLGIMMPYAPLHHLLMSVAEQPLIATSGNISDEPICIDDADALARLNGIADMMLVHDRPIVRHADDSIVRIIGGREAVLRRGRGMAPLPVRLETEPKGTYLAVGAHLKNTIALNVGPSVFISQHIGDLETEQAFDAFKTTVTQLQTLYDADPSAAIADRHPEYLSTKYAQHLKIPVTSMQHHAAHIFSCMAENHLRDDCFGISWDGTGYGEDGTVWGGEFFMWKNGAMERFGTFRSFPLPGGSAAVKEPRRTALGLLYEMYGAQALSMQKIPSLSEFTPQESETLCRMMAQGLNSPRTSSAGRLFDAVSSLIGLQHRTAYEGQAAMMLESLAESSSAADAYPFSIVPGAGGLHSVEWEEILSGIIHDVQTAVPRQDIARKFHTTMSAIILAMAHKAAMNSVVMSGGCFQNALLTEQCIFRLKDSGFTPYWHQRVPPNDGGIALGQLYGTVLQERTINR